MRLRYFLLLALSLLATGPAWAAARDDVMSAATRCAGITDDRSWLDCYYGAAQPMRAQLGLPPAPASQTAKVPPPRAASAAPAPRSQAAPPANRGFFAELFGPSPGVVTTMSSYSFDSRGLFTVTLSNGETWQQLSSDANVAHWREAASKYRVSVSEGINSALLTVNNDGESYHVRRAN
jgi:hypothetical protein